MSIWISSGRFAPRRAIGLALALALATGAGGCSRFATRAALTPSSPAVETRTALNLADRNVVLAGPAGFCVDESASRTDTDPAFVLFASCAALAGDARAPQPEDRALLTASVATAGDGMAGAVSRTSADLDRYFRSEAGRAALARDGDPAKVRVLASYSREGVFYLRARDTGQAEIPGTAPDYWRAYFDVGNQIVSLSVLEPRDKPLGPERSLTLLGRFIDAVRARNHLDPVTPYEVAEAGTAAAPASPYETGPEAEDPSPYETGPVQPAPVVRKPAARRIDPVRALETIGLLRRIFM
ncbi:MAG: hypothetical protein D6832_03010 [Alphaproteobacteria bacterium]|nr:MAG: hypothetical protein D6832_03010 [Alphaproteobacteria bacterium]